MEYICKSKLNEMKKSFNQINNYNVSVKRIDKKIIFLRKLVREGCVTNDISPKEFYLRVAAFFAVSSRLNNNSFKLFRGLQHKLQLHLNLC